MCQELWQHQGIPGEGRVESSHWSRSMEILRSDWLESRFQLSYEMYSPSLKAGFHAQKGSIIGADVMIIDRFCAFQPLISPVSS